MQQRQHSAPRIHIHPAVVYRLPSGQLIQADHDDPSLAGVRRYAEAAGRAGLIDEEVEEDLYAVHAEAVGFDDLNVDMSAAGSLAEGWRCVLVVIDVVGERPAH
ncbi:MAG TPA: hypothetical protein VD860_08625 [Azospirillum sp.]|nr:hypothetical protein [Azospirillum sp.]